MPDHNTPQLFAAVLAACLALGAGTSRAAIIASSPSLPPIGVPFSSPTGVGCFPTAGFCALPGALIVTSIDPDPSKTFFDASGQHIGGDAAFTGTLTNLSHVPVGSFSLTGTFEMGVAGRMSDTATGSWNAELDSLSLTGTVQGGTLTVGLQSSPSSTGMASVEPVAGEEGLFRIDSFFDVFVDLNFGSLHADVGPIRVALAPEPAGLALLAGPVLGLAMLRRRRNA